MEEEKVSRYEELKKKCPLFMRLLEMEIDKTILYGLPHDNILSDEDKKLESDGIE